MAEPLVAPLVGLKRQFSSRRGKIMFNGRTKHLSDYDGKKVEQWKKVAIIIERHDNIWIANRVCANDCKWKFLSWCTFVGNFPGGWHRRRDEQGQREINNGKSKEIAKMIIIIFRMKWRRRCADGREIRFYLQQRWWIIWTEKEKTYRRIGVSYRESWCPAGRLPSCRCLPPGLNKLNDDQDGELPNAALIWPTHYHLWPMWNRQC